MDGRVAAYVLDLFLLEHPEELWLHLQWHVADLVEEDRAAVRYLQFSRLSLRVGARESAFLVAEEFRFKKLPWDGGAVDAYKRAQLAGRGAVDGMGEHFFARARLTGDENGEVRARCLERLPLQGLMASLPPTMLWKV